MLPVAVVASAMAALPGNEPSPADSDVSFEIEPPLLIQNRPVETRPITAAADADPARLEKDLERAKRTATGAEHLCKIGALSKLEAEQRALKVIRLESNLEDARLARAKEELDTHQGRLAASGLSKEDVGGAELALARATAAAEAAAAKRQRAEVEAAEMNLHRQQKLLALGSARKSDVTRAEQKLAELQAPKN
jgi:hypothetical protein